MSENKLQQYVTIKGMKDGLTFFLDDTCSYNQLLQELDEKLSTNFYDSGHEALILVKLNIGNRFVTPEQEEELRTLIRKRKNLVVEKIESNVISKEEALEWKRSTEIVSISRTVRSGQIVEIDGDVMLIGDVNPGGTLIATGNIFIMGALRGIAHAGYHGDRSAIIAASIMTPIQVRICDLMSRGPERYSKVEKHVMECAYINEEGAIVVDRVQKLKHLRPNLNRLEGSM